MKHYAIYLAGGLGDLLLGLLMPGHRAGHIAALRAAEPDAIVVARCMCTSPRAAEELLTDCGLFDEVQVQTWDGSGYIDDSLPVVPQVGAWVRPSLVRLPRRWAGAVAFHPYAGTPDRDWRTHYSSTAIGLVGHGDAIMLGGSGLRVEGKKQVTHTATIEPAHGMVGMPVTLQVGIAVECRAFVGSFSAYHCAAFAAGRAAYVIAPQAMRPFIEDTAHPVYGRLIERPGARFDYFGERSEVAQLDRIQQWLTSL